jgi:hypothetical protein
MLQARPRSVLFTQPGLALTITQPFISGSWVRWMDLSVRLTRLPPTTPRGVLGATFPTLAATPG